MQAEWEGIARDVLEGTFCEDPPVDAFELAACCGLGIQSRGGPASIFGDVIRVDMRMRKTRQHGQVAHEIGHWALRRAQAENTEDGARYIAGALMLPWLAFGRDLRETSWQLSELTRRHPNASAEMIARRIVQLRGGFASIWDRGRAPILLGPAPRSAPFPWERELEAAARKDRVERRLGATSWALPLNERPWFRVVVVGEAG